MIDVFYLTVKSTIPMGKILLGSVQEAENVISAIIIIINYRLNSVVFRISVVVCSSTGHDISSRSRCFLPKSPKTDKIYFVSLHT